METDKHTTAEKKFEKWKEQFTFLEAALQIRGQLQPDVCGRSPDDVAVETGRSADKVRRACAPGQRGEVVPEKRAGFSAEICVKSALSAQLGSANDFFHTTLLKQPHKHATMGLFPALPPAFTVAGGSKTQPQVCVFTGFYG